MSLTNSEETRLQELETIATQLSHLVQGTGSKNMLNRLLTLCQEQVRDLNNKLDELETDMQEILTLVRKLQ